MEVFTVVEHRLESSPTEQGSRIKRCCDFQIPFGVALLLQTAIALGLCALLVWNLLDLDAARNSLPLFGRLGLILSLILSFYLQKIVFSGHREIDEGKLIWNLLFYGLGLLAGPIFWLLQMQYSSSLAQGVANYTSIEPVILVTTVIIGIYILRRLMTHYENNKTQELDIYTAPLFPQLLFAFSVIEVVFAIGFLIFMNFFVTVEYEFSKRCGCLVAIYSSCCVNELAIAFSKESRNALLIKTVSFFANLIGTQFTWWLSYYMERQLTLYGLGVGFLVLLFGVIYTVEMSLQTAQLNSHNPERNVNVANFLQKHQRSGDSLKGNDEEAESVSGTQSSEIKTEMKILNRTCVIGFAITLQIGLALLPVVVLALDTFYPEMDSNKVSRKRISNWCMWVCAFCASLLINELILFQKKISYWLVSLANLCFCINFGCGCALSYRGMSLEEHGVHLTFPVVASMWVPFFVLSHVDFVRLVRFSLLLEEKSIKRPRESDTKISLFFASGIQSMAAVAAFIPTTCFGFFPSKLFSILTFPSLALIAEVIFHYGKKCRGPFLVTFVAFFMGAAYSQMVWYISVLLEEEDEFLGMTRPWLVLVGMAMAFVAFTYVIRFLYIILTKWEKRD